MEVITAVPLLPHPITPTRIAEFTREPKTMSGFKIVTAPRVAAVFRNDLLSIVFVIAEVYVLIDDFYEPYSITIIELLLRRTLVLYIFIQQKIFIS